MYGILLWQPSEYAMPFVETSSWWTLLRLVATALLAGVAGWSLGADREGPLAAGEQSAVIHKSVGFFVAWLAGDLLLWPVYLVVLMSKLFAGILLLGYPMMAMPARWGFLPIVHTFLIVGLYALVSTLQERYGRESAAPNGSGRSLLIAEAAAGLLAGLIYALLVSVLGGHFLLTS